MANKKETKVAMISLFILSYASYTDDDSEIYSETSDVYLTLEDARKALERDFENVREEDFDNYGDDDVYIKRSSNKWEISSSDGDKYITERIQEKKIPFPKFCTAVEIDEDKYVQLKHFPTEEQAKEYANQAVCDWVETYKEKFPDMDVERSNELDDLQVESVSVGGVEHTLVLYAIDQEVKE